MSTRHLFKELKELLSKLDEIELADDVRQLKEAVHQQFAGAMDGSTIYLCWNIEDIHGSARENATDDQFVGDEDEQASPITDEQAREILRSIENRHDASIGVNWTVISTVVSEFLTEQEWHRAYTSLQEMANSLAVEYPHLNVSFGYIGNVERWSDDRSWRFFYNPQAGAACKSFSHYSTDHMVDFFKYMQHDGLTTLKGLLDTCPVHLTDWYCAGSMSEGTGCGKCLKCLNEVDGKGKETP